MKVGIISHGFSNIKSIVNALNFLSIDSKIIHKSGELKNYDTIILPGVGAFKNAMDNLHELGFIEAIFNHVNREKKLIGICLGMQLLFQESHEFGLNKGLGLIKGSVLPLDEKINLRVPHIGWNNVNTNMKEFLPFCGDYYFIHSFYCKPKHNKIVLFETDYGIKFCSGIKKDNIYGIQFHPEKSQQLGLKLFEKIINE